MNKVAIVADSTVDLTPELINENKIKILPLTVNFNNESYHDGFDITTKELYKKIKEKNELPHTAAVTPGEFMQAFEELINAGYDIIFTGIGAKMSKSYENACLVSKEFPEGRIEVVNSDNLSTGTGLLVMKACKWRDEGKDVHEIANLMRETVPYIRSQFVIDTLEYLHKGGRCSGVARLFGTMLKIHPLIEVRDGTMRVGAKPRGKMFTAMDKLVEMLKADAGNIDEDIIFITHSESADGASYLMPIVKNLHPTAKIIETRAGCVISTHCGAGTIGILYILKH